MFDLFGSQQPQTPIGESAESKQQQVLPFYSAPGGQELGRLMLDTSEIIQKTRYLLLGYILIGGKWTRVGEPLVNEKGAAQLVAVLEGHVGKETFLTKITDEDVVRIIKDIWKTVDSLIVKNKELWQMKADKGTWSMIRQVVVNQAYFALRRGEEAIEKGFFADTTKSSYVTNQNSQQQFKKQGFFG